MSCANLPVRFKAERKRLQVTMNRLFVLRKGKKNAPRTVRTVRFMFNAPRVGDRPAS